MGTDPGKPRNRPEGIQLRHARSCESRSGKSCTCAPTYQAQVWSPRDDKPIRKTFSNLAAAKAWRQESQVALRKGVLRAASPMTLTVAAHEWLKAAERGIIRTRSGDAYKPSALRSYRQALQSTVLPELGRLRLTSVTTNNIQDLADRLTANGSAPSTVRNTILPLRAIYRRALTRGDVAINPTLKLTLPAVRGRRERTAHPEEAEALPSLLIQALAVADRALWATATYAGLRRGELQALSWNDIDLQHGLIHVNHAWDRKAGLIEPKSRSGKRRVPITKKLQQLLIAHRLYQGKGGTGYVFTNQYSRPFDPVTIHTRARKAWKTAQLTPLTLHDCRHTYASFAIAAGVNAKALSTYMGHSTITVTLDRYGHLLPGNEQHAANLLDRLLDRHRPIGKPT